MLLLFHLERAAGRSIAPTHEAVGDVGCVTGGRDALLEKAGGGHGPGVVGTSRTVVRLCHVAGGFLVDQAGEAGTGGGAGSCEQDVGQPKQYRGSGDELDDLLPSRTIW